MLDTEKQIEDNNEQEKSAININQIESLDENFQRSCDHSETINFIEENKKISLEGEIQILGFAKHVKLQEINGLCKNINVKEF